MVFKNELMISHTHYLLYDLLQISNLSLSYLADTWSVSSDAANERWSDDEKLTKEDEPQVIRHFDNSSMICFFTNAQT